MKRRIRAKRRRDPLGNELPYGEPKPSVRDDERPAPATAPAAREASPSLPHDRWERERLATAAQNHQGHIDASHAAANAANAGYRAALDRQQAARDVTPSMDVHTVGRSMGVEEFATDYLDGMSGRL